jgi:hypothetical protein
MTTQLKNRTYRWENMAEADAFLRTCDLDAMSSEPRYLFRSRVVASTPLGRAALLVLREGVAPQRAFVQLLDRADMSEIAGAGALLEACLTLSNDWEMRGKCRRSAALLGLLVRVGVATASEWLIVHSASRLHNIIKRHPEVARFGMDPVSLRQIRKAWCRADLKSSGSHPVHVRSIRPAPAAANGPLHRTERRAELECFFGEIVMNERLLMVAEDATAQQFTPLNKERTLFRLMELYAEAPVCGVETCMRGLELVANWALSVSPVPCRSSRVDRVAQLAIFFSNQLAAAGSKRSNDMLMERLDTAVHVLRHRWNGDSAARPLSNLLSTVRRELGVMVQAMHYAQRPLPLSVPLVMPDAPATRPYI